MELLKEQLFQYVQAPASGSAT